MSKFIAAAIQMASTDNIEENLWQAGLLLEEAAAKVLGKENTFPRKEALGGEDFAYYMQYKPGAMFNIGIRDEGMPNIAAHNGKLVVSENALEAAPKIYIQYVLDRMEK